MMQAQPLQDLIERRLADLDLRRSDLARRCGFKNIAKGIRRIDSICGGNLHSQSAKMVIHALPAALQVDRSVVHVAICDTEAMISEGQRNAEAAWRASFVPSAWLLGSRSRPSSITLFVFSGGSQRWLKIPLDLSGPPLTFATQALAVVRRTPSIAFFGATTGFMISYSPDSSVRFDLDGNPVGHLDRAYEPGDASLFISSRRVPERFGFY